MKLLKKYIIFFIFTLFGYSSIAQDTFVESIKPKNTFSGNQIEITGSGLTGIDRVFFGASEGVVISSSDQLVEAEVPSGATYDNVLLFNSTTGLYYSADDFFLSFGGDQGVESSDFDTPQTNIDAASGLFDVVITDIDGDGKNDIVGANSNANFVTIARNLSTPGSLSLARNNLNIQTSSLNVTAGDLNGDGKPELIFSEGNDGDRILILINNSTPGNPNFSIQNIRIEGASTKRIVAKDLDLDGRIDLTISDQTNNQIIILKNTSNGSVSFDNPIYLTVDNAQSTAGLEVEDLNNDGKPEIITNQFLTDGGGFYVATNQGSVGNISFTDFKQFNSAGTFVNLKVADLNNDNKPDVVATLFLSSAVAVFLNQTPNGGVPDFGSAQNISTDRRPWGLDFGDIDGDGDIDIVTSTIGEDKAINVLNNEGGNNLSFNTVSIPVDFINRNIQVGDIDGDSKPDIVFSSVDDDNNNIVASKISILRNNRCIKPIITPEGPINFCEGNTVRLETQKIDGLTYEWFKDGASVKTGPENFIEFSDIASSGTYTVSLSTENGACNEVSEEIEVSITDASTLPSAELSANDPVCTGGTLTLTSTDVGANKYEWRGPEDFTAEGISVEVGNFNTTKAGRYFLDVYSGSCIIDSKSIIVEAVASPNFSITQSEGGILCQGESSELTVSPNNSNYTYQWFDSNGPITDATNVTYNPSESGEYYVEITDQVNAFCPKIYTDTLNVDFLEAPEVNFSLPENACIRTAVAFNDESTVADESLARYRWIFGDGNTSNEKDPTHVYNSEGVFEVSLEVSYEGLSSCSQTFTQEITVLGSINFSITASETSVCEGDEVSLSVEGEFESYSWDTGEETASITVTEDGTYGLTVVDANGCQGFSEIEIEVNPIPEVEIEASSLAVSIGDTVTLAVDGLDSFQWYADSTLIESSSDEIQITPLSTTSIIVEGVDENGCFGFAEVIIEVQQGEDLGDQLEAMKFFSPNGDGVADFWRIQNIQFFSDFEVEIYDQQGNLIYNAIPYNNDWDGTRSGTQVPDGVYYYVVKSAERGKIKAGSITLLR
ncbi:FG-GAP-like repeat-containing protein [Marivirga arenosa]|uniref:FG-GAP-like repeat-containing protein n=1 Tax=Marivirga arenosa TaxID=3059076 RepID=A0AA51ZVJ6_9BACT|nr:FG-GAP-like repeat-containing protein [Marivirga sp. BKB1-2]WNB17530.1 FG-GAP-like repeat-containing protein [Marivirga sp. BKB1-2]